MNVNITTSAARGALLAIALLTGGVGTGLAAEGPVISSLTSDSIDVTFDAPVTVVVKTAPASGLVSRRYESGESFGTFSVSVSGSDEAALAAVRIRPDGSSTLDTGSRETVLLKGQADKAHVLQVKIVPDGTDKWVYKDTTWMTAPSGGATLAGSMVSTGTSAAVPADTYVLTLEGAAWLD